MRSRSRCAVVINHNQVTALRIRIGWRACRDVGATVLSVNTLLPVPSTRVIILLPVFTTNTYFPSRVVQQLQWHSFRQHSETYKPERLASCPVFISSAPFVRIQTLRSCLLEAAICCRNSPGIRFRMLQSFHAQCDEEEILNEHQIVWKRGAVRLASAPRCSK